MTQAYHDQFTQLVFELAEHISQPTNNDLIQQRREMLNALAESFNNGKSPEAIVDGYLRKTVVASGIVGAFDGQGAENVIQQKIAELKQGQIPFLLSRMAEVKLDGRIENLAEKLKNARRANFDAASHNAGVVGVIELFRKNLADKTLSASRALQQALHIDDAILDAASEGVKGAVIPPASRMDPSSLTSVYRNDVAATLREIDALRGATIEAGRAA